MSTKAWQAVFLALVTALVCLALWALWEWSGMTGEIVRTTGAVYLYGVIIAQEVGS